MLTSVAEADIQKSSVGAISVGRLGVGPIQIGRLVINDLDVNCACDGAILRNFRVIIDYSMSLDWRFQIDAPGVLVADTGSVDLGISNFAIDFGDIKLPGLETFNIDIASLTTNNIAATSNPIADLRLGAAIAEQIQARGLKLPTPNGFSIGGLGLGGVKIGQVGAPGASLDAVTIGRVAGEAAPFGPIAIANLGLPEASVADITAQGVDLAATPRPKAYHIDLGCVDLTLKVRPSARAHIDQLVINNIAASTSIGKIELENVVAPYELLNLTLSEIGINSIAIPAVAIA